MEEQIQPTSDQADMTEEKNPLLFWAAYMDGTDGKKHYIGNGKGGYRLFKKRYGAGGIEEFLDNHVKPENRGRVVVHSVQGKINVPVTEQDLEDLKPKTPPKRIADLMPKVPIKLFDKLPVQPIRTGYPDVLPPSAIQAVQDIENKRKRRRRK